MLLAETETHRNGTAAAAFPIKTADITLDEIGYPGWYARVRTNPRASVYDALVSLEDGRWWPAFGQVVLEWNWVDEDGHALPLPREVESERDLDLPHGPMMFLFRSYIDAVRGDANLPKVFGSSSASTSPTSDGPQTGE